MFLSASSRQFYLYVLCEYWMQAAKMCSRKVVHYVADDAKKRVNAAFLIGAYSVRSLGCVCELDRPSYLAFTSSFL